MSISNIPDAFRAAGSAAGQSKPQVAARSHAEGSFSSALRKATNGTPFSDDDVRHFFATQPSVQAMASEAASLGLREDQIAQAMRVGGYGGDDANAVKQGIEQFVADPANGYAWDANGALVSAKVSVSSTPAANAALPSSDDIRRFYATRPTDQQVTAKAKALGLNAAQMVEFQVTGMGINVSSMNASVLETMYVDAANRLGTDIGGGRNGAWTSYFSPTLGRAITSSEIHDFFATNPTQAQIFEKAAALGLGVGAVDNMMNGLGMSEANATYGTRYNMMSTSLFQGRDGYSLDAQGHIVAGGGKHWVADPSGNSGSWVA